MHSKEQYIYWKRWNAENTQPESARNSQRFRLVTFHLCLFLHGCWLSGLLAASVFISNFQHLVNIYFHIYWNGLNRHESIFQKKMQTFIQQKVFSHDLEIILLVSKLVNCDKKYHYSTICIIINLRTSWLSPLKDALCILFVHFCSKNKLLIIITLNLFIWQIF